MIDITMGGKEAEACGRCAMSSAIDVAGKGDEDEREARDPYAGERIEISEAELRKVSPAAWLGGLKRKIDDVATRLTYGK